MDDQDTPDALTEQLREGAQEAAPNDDVVIVAGRLARDLDDG